MVAKPVFRAVLCQFVLVSVPVIAVGACGGAVEGAEPAAGDTGRASTDCPVSSDIRSGASLGRACGAEGTYCADPTCDPCTSACKAVACRGGTWTTAVDTATCTGSTDSTRDAGAKRCIVVDAASFDATCAVDTDCMAATAGTFCEGATLCMCPGLSISVADKARYEAEIQDVVSTLHPTGVCSCPFFGVPRCIAGACRVCGGASGECPDGG